MQLYRRAAAEGLPTIPEMLTVIVRVGDRFRTNGQLGRCPDRDLSNQQMRCLLTEMTTYCGAFLYAGEWASSPETGSIFAPIRHWANEYDGRDRFRPEYQAYLDQVLAESSVIEYGCQTRADNLYTARYQKDGSMWRFTNGFCRQTELNERCGLFLPTGIFQAAAKELGTALTPTYREWFDYAVETYSA